MITPAIETDVATVYAGDCIEVLRADENGYDFELGYGTRRLIPDESIDAVVTDPPYGLEFMGREWDGADGFRRSLNAADAGRDNVFGRASRTSPEYRAGHVFQEWCEAWARECLRVLKPGGHLVAFGGARTWHRLAGGVEDAGFEIRDSIAWLYASGFPKSLDVSKAIDAHLGGKREPDVLAEREGVTTNTVYGKGLGVDIIDRGRAATSEAAAWDGWGTALKPSFEPIVVGRKPLAGTVAQNVLAHGTGALNIDATRVEVSDSSYARNMSGDRGHATRDDDQNGATDISAGGGSASDLGRWPSNVVLSHSPLLDEHGEVIGDACADGCVPGCAVAELDSQSGVRSSGFMKAGQARQGQRSVFPSDSGAPVSRDTYGDEGGASRFYPVFRFEAKAPSSERPKVNGVQHPTVKPVGLMRWLVRLVTRPGGRVLEPFTGSGTTVEAAVLEGMTVVASERELAYIPLIESRLSKPMQQSLFDDLLGGDAA